jgi:hypothetical protein
MITSRRDDLRDKLNAVLRSAGALFLFFLY